jgi:hypothetical protein
MLRTSKHGSLGRSASEADARNRKRSDAWQRIEGRLRPRSGRRPKAFGSPWRASAGARTARLDEEFLTQRLPDLEGAVLGCQRKVSIGCQHRQLVADAKLRQQRVNRTQLNTGTATNIP